MELYLQDQVVLFMYIGRTIGFTIQVENFNIYKDELLRHETAKLIENLSLNVRKMSSRVVVKSNLKTFYHPNWLGPITIVL